MAAPSPPHTVDTVIIGNGPSALILSYILHGHVPYYVGGHHDSLLDLKLSRRPCLLDLSSDLYAHFLSSLRYSTQALPVNTLLDTLLRPNADTEINPRSCIEWRYEPEKAVAHLAIGDAHQPGGQWADNPVSASADIGTLSYAEQLSLPGYSYAEHLARSNQDGQCDFVRPSRTEIADYLKAYPEAVGISDAIRTATKVDNVYRTANGFMIASLGIRCKHLVLASGIFTVNIPPPPLLAPVAALDSTNDPLLVIGSGFSAADVIISAPPTRKIIHIFQWAPDTRPSPLHGCHHTAYPEYATVYRQMKLAAISSHKALSAKAPLLRRKSNPFFTQRDWPSCYEGFPNAEILSVDCPESTGTATVTIRTASDETITRTVGGLEYVVGRRGSLGYLSPELQTEVIGTIDDSAPNPNSSALISGRTLRSKAQSSLEVAKNVFVIGSLAGDSLIRHAVGGCVFAAGRILGYIPRQLSGSSSPSSIPSSPSSRSLYQTPEEDVTDETKLGHANGTTDSPAVSVPESISSATSVSNFSVQLVNGHSDLHLDRRKLARNVDVANAENRAWVDSGWWAGGLGPLRPDVS